MLNIARLAAMLALTVSASAAAMEASPGVTSTEVKVGSTFPFSGPASFLGNTGKALIAYVGFINDKGGINGRKINLITYDDAYSPSKAAEQTRRLVESDDVAFVFGPVGTPSNSAMAKYLTAKGVPHSFILSGSAKFTDVKEYPMTTTALPSYVTEGAVYAKYIVNALPSKAKIGILYQNDDLGRDFVTGFKSVLKDEFPARVLAVPYEVTDPTVDSQMVNLKNSGAEALLVAATPKFTSQALRKANELGWKPLIIINGVSASIAATLRPVGLDKVIGIVSATFFKDPVDPKWKDDQGVQDYVAFFRKYLPGADIADQNYTVGVLQGMILEQLLRQCGDDLSRKNVARQSRSFKDVILPMALPGVKVNTSGANNQAYRQAQLQRWTGESWERFDAVINAE